MDFVYLDNAATAYPKSTGVFGAVKAAFFNCGNGSRSGHPLSLAASERVYACRSALAERFGARPEDVVLTSGATLALNMAIKGLARGRLLCSTLEHNAVLRPLYALKEQGQDMAFFTPSFADPGETVARAKKALKNGAGLMVITHASNVCGVKLPVKELCDLARGVGALTVVDCAQTAGHIPVDIGELGADVICFAGHKGLGGPMGVGALVVNPKATLHFKPLIEGGTGMASRDSAMPPFLPERLEPGTANIMGIAGLLAACEELDLQPEREEALRQAAVEALTTIRGVKVYAPSYSGGYAPVVAFNIGNLPSDRGAELLAQRGIYVRGGLHCAPLAHSSLGTGGYGAIRASFGRHNRVEDVEKLAEAVREISG